MPRGGYASKSLKPALPSGWRRIKGSGPRRYRDPQGGLRTEYAYRNYRAQQAGWESYWDYRKTSKDDRFYNQTRVDAIIEHGLTKRQTGMTSEFAELYTAQRNAAQSDRDLWHDPEGPMADFLVYVGYRDQEDWWDVGDTPQMGG